MVTRKHSRSGDALAPDASTNPSVLPVASKRVRKSAPIEKLLDIFELCEQVLDNLSMDDILHSMQACRAFKSNVENSTKLQMKLFLTPDHTRQNRTAISSKCTLLSGAKAAQHIAAAEAASERETGEIMFYIPHPIVQPAPRHPSIQELGLVAYVACRVKNNGLSARVAIRNSILSSADLWFKQPTSLRNMFFNPAAYQSSLCLRQQVLARQQGNRDLRRDRGEV